MLRYHKLFTFKTKNKTGDKIDAKIDQKYIPWVSRVKFRGLQLDASLTWESYFHSLAENLVMQ
jgi:hypothetical protein